jgi:hypothetical protein
MTQIEAVPKVLTVDARGALSARLAEVVSPQQFLHNDPRAVNGHGLSSFDLNQLVPIYHMPLPAEVSGHFFKDFILKQGLLSPSDIRQIICDARLDLGFERCETGTVVAAPTPNSSYSNHAWTRDSAIVACALRRAGSNEDAAKIVENLAMTYGHEAQRMRFVSFHNGSDPVGRYRREDFIPHIRMSVDSSGRMVESKEPWGHNQLDAIGEWLWVTFRLAADKVVDLKSLNAKIDEVNPNNKKESIFVAALKFLSRIEFWDQNDFGPWEKYSLDRRASSIGICRSALQEASRYFNESGWDALAVDYNSPKPERRLRRELQYALGRSRVALLERIPDTPDGVAVEADHTPRDAALISLLYPFNPGLTQNQENAILRAVMPLMGTHGFRRWPEDVFVGQDYANRPDQPNAEIQADTSKLGWKPAEWPMFVSMLQGHYSRRFIESGGNDTISLRQADQLLKWGLSLVTPEPEELHLKYRQERVTLPAGLLPEAYWYDSQADEMRPNHHSPLAMAKAFFVLGVERHLEALSFCSSRRSES